MVSEPGATNGITMAVIHKLLAEIIKSVKTVVFTHGIDKFAEQELFTPLGINKYEWLPLVKNMPPEQHQEFDYVQEICLNSGCCI